METAEYLAALFDHEREGLRHIGQQIAGLLDLRSLVQLKRSCHLLHTFLWAGRLEQRALGRKLRRDWQGRPRVRGLDLGPSTPVTGVRLVQDGAAVLAAVGPSLHLLPTARLQPEEELEPGPGGPGGALAEGLKLKLRLPSNSLNAKINDAFSGTYSQNGLKVPSVSGDSDGADAVRTFTNGNENLEKNQVTEFDLLHDCLVAGNNNGILSVWDFHSGELLVSKQLFGIITGLRCLPAEDCIVTTHAGKAFDMGVVTVRKMVSPSELVVLWSVYQDVMPVFCFDVNSRWIVTLEWLGTFDLAHVGSASVYSRGSSVYTRRDLGESRAGEGSGLVQLRDRHTRFTAAAIFREDYLVVASDAGHGLVTWHLPSLTPLHHLPGHAAAVMQILACGDRLLSLDKTGDLVLWDADSASAPAGPAGEEPGALLRRVEVAGEPAGLLGVDLDLRRVGLARLGGLTILDFWDAEQEGIINMPITDQI